MVNVYLYSVFGQAAGSRRIKDESITAYRNRWLDALLVGTDVTAVLALGDLATTAYAAWAATRPDTAAVAAPRGHPPPDVRRGVRARVRPAARRDHRRPARELERAPRRPRRARDARRARPTSTPYAATWGPTDLVGIPEVDLPPGAPSWWRDVDAWASRAGADKQTKRATISVVVPKGARTWPAL